MNTLIRQFQPLDFTQFDPLFTLQLLEALAESTLQPLDSVVMVLVPVHFKSFAHFSLKRRGRSLFTSVQLSYKRNCFLQVQNFVCEFCMMAKIVIGEQEIPGLTDTTVPRRLGPKRASKIRKLFNLSKNDDVRKYVIRRKLPEKEGSS